MTSSVPLVGYLTRPTVQSKLQAFAEELAAHVCTDLRNGSEEFRVHVEDNVADAVEDVLRELKVEDFAEWPQFRGVAGL